MPRSLKRLCSVATNDSDLRICDSLIKEIKFSMVVNLHRVGFDMVGRVEQGQNMASPLSLPRTKPRAFSRERPASDAPGILGNFNRISPFSFLPP